MLEKIENSIADAQMVLVGIGAEMEADMDGKDASFYDSLRSHPACTVLYFSLCAGLSNAKRCSVLDVRRSCTHSGCLIYGDHVSVYPVFVR